MYMNMQKTKALQVQDLGKLEVKTDNAEIENAAKHKLLGMTIDEDLTYEVHVDD